ncbi:PhaM family polyhydroxyalkanoate granule multifunctional regulatory protein [Comamonas sp. GB3 AK4-5]|uniref:PhaM family polyhydroxyalkanoate granule multifunctional regulatory protein n=1 Tax=Comamonas sp. GB3 AK4-5 TaxID=3231487 RepID=UPI00351DFBBE
MSDSAAFGFGKFIPGFDFLNQLGQAGASKGMPPLSHWVAPTVSVEEISKRIEELKAVQFWLEQNSRALSATVQALEVQKMTLHTLQGMNVSMADLAKSFAGPGNPMQAAAAPAAGEHADWPMSSGGAKSRKKSAAAAKPERAEAEAHAAAAAQAAQEKTAAAGAASHADAAGKADKADAGAHAGAAAGMGDPMLWWGALSQQFQQIAGQALQDPAQQQAMAKATHMATDFTKAAMQAASQMARKAAEGVKAASSAATPGRKASQAAGGTAAPAAKTTARAPSAAQESKPSAAAKPAAKRPAAAKKAAARKPASPAAKSAASAKSVAGRR